MKFKQWVIDRRKRWENWEIGQRRLKERSGGRILGCGKEIVCGLGVIQRFGYNEFWRVAKVKGKLDCWLLEDKLGWFQELLLGLKLESWKINWDFDFGNLGD